MVVDKGVSTTPLPIPFVNTETAWSQMCLDGKHFLVGVRNRPPNKNSDGLDELPDLILAASKEYVLLGGDFNIPDLIWKDGMATCSGSTLNTKLSSIVEIFDLTQYVIEGTRLLNVLDLLCNLPGAIKNVCVLPGISNYKIMKADLVHQKKKI